MEPNAEGSEGTERGLHEDGDNDFLSIFEKTIPEGEFVKGLTLMREEVEVVAQQHLRWVNDFRYNYAAYGQVGGGGGEGWRLGRLRTIRKAAGEKAFESMIEPVKREFREAYDGLEDALAVPGRCEICGKPFRRASVHPDETSCNRSACRRAVNERHGVPESLPRDETLPF